MTYIIDRPDLDNFYGVVHTSHSSDVYHVVSSAYISGKYTGQTKFKQVPENFELHMRNGVQCELCFCRVKLKAIIPLCGHPAKRL